MVDNLGNQEIHRAIDPKLQIGDAVTEQARHEELLKSVKVDSDAERNAFLNNGGGFVGKIRKTCGKFLGR